MPELLRVFACGAQHVMPAELPASLFNGFPAATDLSIAKADENSNGPLEIIAGKGQRAARQRGNSANTCVKCD
ncbi:hypothetical protein [Allofournierella sp.]|uniref:hypothetical protein n=1 Tax=Allofournierella sp. TaxID=1940256 RepID=UPI003AB26B78